MIIKIIKNILFVSILLFFWNNCFIKNNNIKKNNDYLKRNIFFVSAIISSISSYYFFKKISKEKEEYKELYKYKGNFLKFLEDLTNSECNHEKKEDIINIAKKHTYSNTFSYDWKMNTDCVDSFLTDLITTIFNKKEVDIQKAKKFFLNGAKQFNDYISSLFFPYSPDKIHSILCKAFRNKSIQINSNGKKSKEFTFSVGSMKNYEEVKKSMPGRIQNKNFIDKIKNQFMIMKWLYTKEQYTATLSYPMTIFHGDPGTGKTVRVKEIFLSLCDGDDINKKTESYYFELNASDILAKYVGESEGNITTFFNDIKKIASEMKDTDNFILIHIDEIDALLGNRNKANQTEWSTNIVNVFLNKIDEFRNEILPVVFFGTTNYAEKIDDAAKRNGRLVLERIDQPHDDEKEEILNFYITYFNDKKYTFNIKEDEKKKIIESQKTGADIRQKVESHFLTYIENVYNENQNEKMLVKKELFDEL